MLIFPLPGTKIPSQLSGRIFPILKGPQQVQVEPVLARVFALETRDFSNTVKLREPVERTLSIVHAESLSSPPLGRDRHEVSTKLQFRWNTCDSELQQLLPTNFCERTIIQVFLLFYKHYLCQNRTSCKNSAVFRYLHDIEKYLSTYTNR